MLQGFWREKLLYAATRQSTAHPEMAALLQPSKKTITSDRQKAKLDFFYERQPSISPTNATYFLSVKNFFEQSKFFHRKTNCAG